MPADSMGFASLLCVSVSFQASDVGPVWESASALLVAGVIGHTLLLFLCPHVCVYVALTTSPDMATLCQGNNGAASSKAVAYATYARSFRAAATAGAPHVAHCSQYGCCCIGCCPCCTGGSCVRLTPSVCGSRASTSAEVGRARGSRWTHLHTHTHTHTYVMCSDTNTSILEGVVRARACVCVCACVCPVSPCCEHSVLV